MDRSTSAPFPEIRTPRFHLRQIVSDDIPTVFEGLSHPEVIEHYGVRYSSIEETRLQMEWFDQIYSDGTGIWWGISDSQASSPLIGAVGLNDISLEHQRAEIGYWLLPSHWGRGVAKECASAVVTYAFETMRLHRIGAEVDLGNARSATLLERLGFTFEGARRDYEVKNGAHIDLKYYGLLATDSSADAYRARGGPRPRGS